VSKHNHNTLTGKARHELAQAGSTGDIQIVVEQPDGSVVGATLLSVNRTFRDGRAIVVMHCREKRPEDNPEITLDLDDLR